MNLLKRFNLKSKATFYPEELSGGQKQRVAIIRSIALKPSFILFDEPTSVLDYQAVNDFIERCNELAKRDLGVIIITHDLIFAQKVSHKIIHLDNGFILKYKEDYYEKT